MGDESSFNKLTVESIESLFETEQVFKSQKEMLDVIVEYLDLAANIQIDPLKLVNIITHTPCLKKVFVKYKMLPSHHKKNGIDTYHMKKPVLLDSTKPLMPQLEVPKEPKVVSDTEKDVVKDESPPPPSKTLVGSLWSSITLEKKPEKKEQKLSSDTQNNPLLLENQHFSKDVSQKAKQFLQDATFMRESPLSTKLLLHIQMAACNAIIVNRYITHIELPINTEIAPYSLWKEVCRIFNVEHYKAEIVTFTDDKGKDAMKFTLSWS